MSRAAGRRASRLNGPTRLNLSEFIGRFAAAGREPAIAGQLGITVHQVRGIRRDFGIEAGEQRWTGRWRYTDTDTTTGQSTLEGQG